MSTGTVVFRRVNLFMAFVFILCTAVQYNDPDPLLWTVVYGLSAIFCILAHKGQLHGYLPAALGLISLVWAGAIARNVYGVVTLREMFGSMGMKTLAIEEGRESLGLLLVTGWMGVLATVRRRRQTHD